MALALLVVGCAKTEQAQSTHYDELAKLPFPGAYPTEESTKILKDELAFQRAVQTYLWSLPAMNMYAMCEGQRKVFDDDSNTLMIAKDRIDYRLEYTTGNPDVIYAFAWLDLKKEGPTVMDMPPNCRGCWMTCGIARSLISARLDPTRAKAASISSFLPIMRALFQTVIEKGKPFKPTASQKKILSQAALVGEAMAKANDFYNPRIKASIYREGSAWEIATTSPANQRWKNYDALDGRAAWFYEALTNGPAMNSQKPGWGQKYLASYLDSDKDWLDGAQSYKLHVPADVPAAAFWSLTVYDVSTRCPIDNKTKQADRSSRMELLKNSDGSIDLYFGPEAPKGKEKNWVQTVKGKAWFPYFRLYSPTERFFDQSWILPDIEKANK